MPCSRWSCVVSEKVVRNTYRDYGFESLDDILFVEGNAKEHTEPGWDLFEMEIAERLSAYDSVAIAQMNAEENGGAYEQKAAELVRRHSSLPIVCAYHPSMTGSRRAFKSAQAPRWMTLRSWNR